MSHIEDEMDGGEKKIRQEKIESHGRRKGTRLKKGNGVTEEIERKRKMNDLHISKPKLKKTLNH